MPKIFIRFILENRMCIILHKLPWIKFFCKKLRKQFCTKAVQILTRGFCTLKKFQFLRIVILSSKSQLICLKLRFIKSCFPGKNISCLDSWNPVYSKVPPFLAKPLKVSAATWRNREREKLKTNWVVVPPLTKCD